MKKKDWKDKTEGVVEVTQGWKVKVSADDMGSNLYQSVSVDYHHHDLILLNCGWVEIFFVSREINNHRAGRDVTIIKVPNTRRHSKLDSNAMDEEVPVVPDSLI